MITKLILHHSADPSSGNQFTKINSYHKAKGFPKSLLGFHVGYTYVCEKNGDIKQARTEEERGAHTVPDPGFCEDNRACGDLNHDALAVCFAGDLRFQLLTDEQKASGESLLLSIMSRWQMTPQDILNHSDVSDTSCPGRNLVSLFLKDMEPKFLQLELRKAENGLRYASIPRRKMLERKIKRLKDMLSAIIHSPNFI